MVIDLSAIYAQLVALGPKLPEAIPVINDIADNVRLLQDGTNAVELLKVAVAVSGDIRKLITIFGTVPASSLQSATAGDLSDACTAQGIDGHRVKWLIDFAESHPELIALILKFV